MTTTKADKLTAVTLNVFRLNGLLIEWGNSFSKPHGLTSARWQVLGSIALAGRALNVPQIAAAMGITRQGALKQIDLLTREGLVESRPNPMHKRSPLYALTKKGQNGYEAVVESWREQAKNMAVDFSAADLDATVRVLSALSQIQALNTINQVE